MFKIIYEATRVTPSIKQYVINYFCENPDIPDGECYPASFVLDISSASIKTVTYESLHFHFANSAINLVRYLSDNNYKDIILSGKSFWISQILIEQAWARIFPKKSMPDIHIFDSEINGLIYKNCSLSDYQRQVQVQSLIRDKYAVLYNARHQQICCIDDISYSGDKHQGYKKMLLELGFTDINFAYLTAKETASNDSSFIGLINGPNDYNYDTAFLKGETTKHLKYIGLLFGGWNRLSNDNTPAVIEKELTNFFIETIAAIEHLATPQNGVF